MAAGVARRPARRRSTSALGAPCLVVVLAAVLALVAPFATEAGGVQREDEDGGELAERVYLRDCSSCHGPAGRGTNRGPSLVGAGTASVDYMVRTGRMPIDEPDDAIERGDPRYPPALVDALVRYVGDLGAGEPGIPDVDPAAGDVSRGGELFRLQCAACHAWGGTGGAILPGAVPPVHPADPVTAAEAMRIGPGAMPAFGEAALDDDELDDVLAYLGYLESPRNPGGLPAGHLGPAAEGAVAWVFGGGALLLGLLAMGRRAGHGGDPGRREEGS